MHRGVLTAPDAHLVQDVTGIGDLISLSGWRNDKSCAVVSTSPSLTTTIIK